MLGTYVVRNSLTFRAIVDKPANAVHNSLHVLAKPVAVKSVTAVLNKETVIAACTSRRQKQLCHRTHSFSACVEVLNVSHGFNKRAQVVDVTRFRAACVLVELGRIVNIRNNVNHLTEYVNPLDKLTCAVSLVPDVVELGLEVCDVHIVEAVTIGLMLFCVSNYASNVKYVPENVRSAT